MFLMLTAAMDRVYLVPVKLVSRKGALAVFLMLTAAMDRVYLVPVALVSGWAMRVQMMLTAAVQGVEMMVTVSFHIKRECRFL